MPRTLTSPPAGESSSPTVSVSEAIGLPADWTLASALKGDSGTAAPDKPADDEPLPGEGEGREGPKEGDEKPEEGALEGAEPEGGEPEPKPEAKPAKKAAEAKLAAEAKPAAGAKPIAETKPAKGAKPGAKPAAEVKPVVASAPETKIKLGDKEYTQKELEDLIAKGKTPAVAETPGDKPAEKKVPTAEEVAAQQLEIKKNDSDWIAANARSVGVPEISEADLDEIMAGGKKGIEKLTTLLRVTGTNAVLAARKSLFAEIGPIFDELKSRQEPLLEAHMRAEDEREWTSFAGRYEDLANDRQLVENASSVIIEKEGAKLKGLTMEQFQDRVATEVRTFKKNFVTAPAAAETMEIDGKVYTKDQIAALVAGKPAEGGLEPKPAAGAAVKPGAVAAAAKPARAAVKPPGANIPAATPGKGTKGASGDSAIISTLF